MTETATLPATLARIILLIFTIGIYNSYAQNTIIKGKIDGIGKTPVQFRYKLNGKSHIDTIFAQNDHFKYIAKGSDDSTLIVFIKSPRYFSLWLEPGEINVSGSAAQPSRLHVKGGTENTLTEQYNTGIGWFYDDLITGKPDSVRARLVKDKEAKTMAFIQSHPASRMAANLLYWQSVYHEEEIASYDALWQSFTPHVRGSRQGNKLSQRLAVIRNQPAPGKSAPDFTISDATGNPVSLKDFRGKYVLLDFWGHWCGPCVQTFPQLKALNKRLSEKMTIVGIAAESPDDRSKWLNMIKTNELNWVQLSEFETDNGKVNLTYNIMAFPTYFLIDKNGVLISKSNSLNDIESAIESVSDLK